MTNIRLRALLSKRFHIPKEHSIQRAVSRFTSAEKTVFYLFTGIFFLSGVLLLLRVNNSFLVDVPINGGSITEGVIGNPRFINPVLAISEADKNLVSLVYSGLVRTNKNGEIVNDLAESVSLSPDNLTYTVVLRPDVTFQDETVVTSDDIVFTIQKILDPGIKSPLFADFAGVTVSKVDERTVSFVLKQPFAPFMNNLTVGVLPKHIWSAVTNDEFSFSQWNILPIGSGPYKVDSVTRDSAGIPNYYDLIPFKNYIDGRAYISHFIFKFFPSETSLVDAFSSGDVQSLGGISPEEALVLEKDGAKILSASLPRIFGVFFNQNSNKALLDKSVRKALDLITPKQEIVDQVLGGFGSVIKGPMPPALMASENVPEQKLSRTERLETASSTLAKAGWVKNKSTGILEKKSKTDTVKLSFSLSTSDNPDLRKVAEMLQKSWQELGAEVKISIYNSGDLNQNVIRPRHYEALLFGEVVGREADVYPFWHSSERNDPGLNIALYANKDVDKLLETARSENNIDKREDLYRKFEETIRDDVPAVFIYSPGFIYIVPPTVRGMNLGKLGATQDRFVDVRNWYIETNAVWNIFSKNS
ncbi:MAG: ABC transporter substrate-binding protein [Patescibacteria group bacterium]